MKDRLLELALPSIRLLPGTGRSHLGGVAELPPGTEWPERNGSPLSVIAELFLEELVPHDQEALLPRSGSLVFFYDAEEQPWGFDPADRDGFAVVSVPEGVATEARSEGEVFPPLQLNAHEELTLPPDPSALGLDDREQDAYFDLLGALDDTNHHCLGHPDQIQGDMQLEAQLVTNGLYCGDDSGYNDPRADELASGAASWRLLLQVDSDEDRDMYWGDVGRLYYWIREEDLRRRSLNAAWLILQCT